MSRQPPTRSQWKLMLRRCENPHFPAYRYYGARGIKVCERWHDFETYYADIMRLIGPCPADKTLDRIDNDGNYEPGNVRWATSYQQVINSRTCLPGAYREQRAGEIQQRRAARRAEAAAAREAAREADRQAEVEQRRKKQMLLTTEVCTVLGIDRTEFLQLVHDGELQAMIIRVDARKPRITDYRVSQEWLEEYIARRLPDQLAATS